MHIAMNARYVVLAAMSLLFAGCASVLESEDISVRLGMSRTDLKDNFGGPLRIEPDASGGESWYYHFVSWKTTPTQEAGTTEAFGERTTYVSVGIDATRTTEECPIHLSAEGYVIEPLPTGKISRK